MFVSLFFCFIPIFLIFLGVFLLTLISVSLILLVLLVSVKSLISPYQHFSCQHLIWAMSSCETSLVISVLAHCFFCPFSRRRILAPGEEENLEFEEDEEEGGAGAGSPDSFPARVPGTLLPRLPSEPGMTLLTIRIEKIGLKDAGQCIDPYITVSVKDLNGIDLTPVQDTPVASRKEDTYVHFNVDIELQKHVEKLTKGAAIFFEFKHYKPKKRFTSTKCFAFMEMDEIKPGPIVIELYKKPTDFKRKKLQLLTKKPLYLHLHQTLHKE
uniref:Axin interactor, dorsalization-associated protein n=1 Tax=Oryctolagus cuniculus TaxID=9986 RepID=A0A5F9C9D5_RABIT